MNGNFILIFLNHGSIYFLLTKMVQWKLGLDSYVFNSEGSVGVIMTKEEFIETYYREHYKERLKFARKRVGDYNLALAEEALQEAFYRALKYYKAYDKNENFDHWFGKILVNCINDVKNTERDQGRTDHHDTSHVIEKEETLTRSKIAISQLNKEKPRNQEILRLSFFLGYDSREVSDFMGISHDVVRDVIRTYRARVRNA